MRERDRRKTMIKMSLGEIVRDIKYEEKRNTWRKKK